MEEHFFGFVLLSWKKKSERDLTHLDLELSCLVKLGIVWSGGNLNDQEINTSFLHFPPFGLSLDIGYILQFLAY